MSGGAGSSLAAMEAWRKPDKYPSSDDNEDDYDERYYDGTFDNDND